MITAEAFIPAYIARWEGSPSHYYSSDANDAGNWSSGIKGAGTLIGSNYGVTAKTLAAFRSVSSVTKAEMMALTLAEAATIAKRLFYTGPGLDRLLWNRVTASVLDFGWGAGPTTAVKLLQNMLDVAPDGVIGVGGQTAQAYATWLAAHGEVCAAGAWWARRGAFYENLIASRPSDAAFRNGWDARSRWFLPGDPEGWWSKAA